MALALLPQQAFQWRSTLGGGKKAITKMHIAMLFQDAAAIAVEVSSSWGAPGCGSDDEKPLPLPPTLVKPLRWLSLAGLPGWFRGMTELAWVPPPA